MNAELKAKWLSALRSGAIKQARETLQSADGMCCLGVLCTVLPPIPGVLVARHGEVEFERCSDKCESLRSKMLVICELGDEGEVRSDVELPGPLLVRLGLLDWQTLLINMNDGCATWANNPQNFAQIADWIERNIPADPPVTSSQET